MPNLTHINGPIFEIRLLNIIFHTWHFFLSLAPFPQVCNELFIATGTHRNWAASYTVLSFPHWQVSSLPLAPLRKPYLNYFLKTFQMRRTFHQIKWWLCGCPWIRITILLNEKLIDQALFKLKRWQCGDALTAASVGQLCERFINETLLLFYN